MPKLQPRRPWHHYTLEWTLSDLETTEAGLTRAEARRRLAEVGANRLPEKPPPPLWLIFLRQFLSPFIYILLAAAAISIFTGDPADAGFIFAILLLNAAIGTWQEWKAEQSSLALRKLLRIRALVERDGEPHEISAEDVVPGDLVWLESGNRVPADIRLLSSQGLEIDESLLTGESLAVAKDPSWRGEEKVPIGDRANMAFAGAIVTRGRAKGLVVATGAATQVGQLATDVIDAEGGKPPLIERMEKFTNAVAIGTLTASGLIGAVAVAVGRYPWDQIFMFIVALAVSAIPEGLPVAMTVALAIATTRMARRGVIVRRLSAVEGLGSCTMIATDKTGTLTVNELTAREVWLPTGERFKVTGEGFMPEGKVFLAGHQVKGGDSIGLERFARAATLCNESSLRERDGQWDWRGDAVDIALLAFGRKLGWVRETAVAECPQVNQIPFESERQFAATYHIVEGLPRVFVKGAPERVLAMCRPKTDRQAIERVALEMASNGLRTLALAEAKLQPGEERGDSPPTPKDLKFLGLVGMIDPLRPGARTAIAHCHDAGIDVVMVTGDHKLTALAIAQDLGLADNAGQVMTGADLDAISSDQLVRTISRYRVFARVAPRQKLELVEAARKAGRFVAVTGDGVNDAPALRAANIGVAMGKMGSDVAREAAELVISDDNFATIVAGVEEGRVAYDNIRKVIFLLLSAGAAELGIALLAILFGHSLPLLPVQLLWLNLVTDGIQSVAIGFEPAEPDTLRRKPRPPGEGVFNALMIERLVIAAVVMMGLGFGAWVWMINHGHTEPQARNILLLLMVMFENFHVGNCRSETRSAFAVSPLKSPMLLGGAISAFLVHVAAMNIPLMQKVLGVGPVPFQTWLIVTAVAFTVVPVMELHKLWWNRRNG